MRYFIIGLLIILELFYQAHAQQVTITGKVTDTLEKRTLTNAVVSILQKKTVRYLNLPEVVKVVIST